MEAEIRSADAEEDFCPVSLCGKAYCNAAVPCPRLGGGR